ncbi:MULTISPECIES: GNAT family N-acetyltransferase [Silvimonas]|uniref:GNAT family N-acetyltransferase n=1 Tax=Silvimonas TaxID=300264 RepID=UPI0024B39C62|nr:MULTISPECIES: GNAT family N-acetyltransferase [Silvimonas]MDR3426753.1 GNAT family N-acetyltransferase [Silvimonas sp.]
MSHFQTARWQQGAFEVDTDPARLNLNLETAYDFIGRQSYWAKGMPFETFHRSVQGALCFGIYEGERLVGFARVITDGATIGYLGDVFIDTEHRGQGLSKWLLQCIHTHPDLQGLRRWMLFTADAHGLYEQFGWKPAARPERYLERLNTDPYKQ